MRNLLKKIIGSDDLEIKERLFRIILAVTYIIAIASIFEESLVAASYTLLIPTVGLFIVLVISTVAISSFKRYDVAAVLFGLAVLCMTLPMNFFVSGGLTGGGACWFIIGIMYIFLMFDGKALIFFVTLSFVTDFICFYMAYNNKEMVTHLTSEIAIYADVFFAVVLIGVLVGSVMKYQKHLYETERKIAMKQKEELESIVSGKDAFFANMSHEIRTPINSIIGLNEMILRDEITSETEENALMIQNASKTLLSLVNDILDLSKIENKKMEIVPTNYSTKNLFSEMVEMIQIRMKQKHLDFIVNIDSQIPTVLYGDDKRIKQVLLNILTNAVKYTEEGNVSLSARAEKIGEEYVRLEISVADTGLGIRKEDLDHLYDSFVRVENMQNRSIEGTGLGLSICKQLMDLMDGEITVDSIYTKGSTFTITLEQKIVDITPIGVNNFLAKSFRMNRFKYHQLFEAPEAKILVVDDEAMNLLVVSKLLSETKLQIETAKSGKECLELVKKKYYNLILMDHMMPEMDGVETLKQIRVQPGVLCPDVPIIALTANAPSGGVLSYQNLGFDGYIEKPIVGTLLEQEILKSLPPELVEIRHEDFEEHEEPEFKQFLEKVRKKKIRITTDCAADISSDLIEKYGIKIMYLYIKTQDGRFTDTKELGTDNMITLLEHNSSTITSESASVEEYESFFAEGLTEAEEIIHISLASGTGVSYSNALQASKGFGHVHVIDGGHISCGLAVVVLYAAKLALEGMSVEYILNAVESVKDKISTKFIMPNGEYLYKTGYINSVVSGMIQILHIKPSMRIHKSRLEFVGGRWGSLEKIRKKFVRLHTRYRQNIDTDFIYVTHTGLSYKEQELLREELVKYHPFSRVYMEKASFSNTCRAGLGTIGIAFYIK